VKVNSSFSFLENNHFHTHLAAADVSTCLLHYKFVGAVSDRIDEAIDRKEHFLGATFYKDLSRAIKTTKHASNDTFSHGPDTLKFSSAQDLVAAGVMKGSHEWLTFNEDGSHAVKIEK